ncbi:MAG: PolC-type DNA polymerase III, partial [Lachnospiraceae bacterium]|nr:PolC-type DNA polymerase III [Lachnospiraceae bacterium]
TEEELLDVNREIVRLGEQFHKPVCATGDVHFMDPEDAFYRQVLQEGNGFKDAGHQPPLYFKTTDEMLSEFGYLGSDKAFEIVVTNTNKISDMVESISPVRKGKFPPVIPNAAETLKEVCYKTAHGIYGDTLPDFVNDRLERELNSIISNGYAVMYLIARKLVMKSVSDGYVVGSRGSVGSSLVATMSGITEVNPLKPHYHCPKCHHTEAESEEIRLNGKNSGCDLPDKVCPVCGEKMNKLGFDIPFETFLGFKGDKEPDIDLNFSGEYQTKAHAYTEVIFGKGQTFRAGTISGIKDKTAIGYFRHYFEEHGEEKRRAELERLSKKLEGVRKTTGQHPGGIVVLPFGEEIQTFTPIQHPSDKTDTNIITTSFEYHAIDENLLKLDILGHDDPTMIRMIEDLTGLDPTEFPLDAPEVIRLFQGTEVLNISPSDIGGCPLGALGIPEFGTEFAMNMVIACKPVNFSDLVRISGMAHGENVWSNNNQILFETGVADLSTAICCRDDIMLYLISMGMDPSLSFSIMEKVRKGKGLTKEWEEEMSSHGVPDWYIDSCNKIKYMFPKAHAVAYVMMAWRIAYCKIHYPTAFYCSFFSIRADEFNYEKMAEGRVTLMKHMEKFENTKFPSDKEKQEYRVMQLVNEFYARGFRFVPLDLDKANATLFTIADEKSLMPSLTSIDGMGEAAADSIIQAIQTKKPFSSVQNFRDRTHVSQTIIEKLLSLKILKDLPRSDQFSLFDEMG